MSERERREREEEEEGKEMGVESTLLEIRMYAHSKYAHGKSKCNSLKCSVYLRLELHILVLCGLI